jgi:hypothetical protein
VRIYSFARDDGILGMTAFVIEGNAFEVSATPLNRA